MCVPGEVWPTEGALGASLRKNKSQWRTRGGAGGGGALGGLGAKLRSPLPLSELKKLVRTYLLTYLLT